MLELIKINKSFSKSTEPVLKDIHLLIKRGEFFSLLGPSGCGKTTLLKILAGFDESFTGQLILNGVDIQKLGPRSRPFNMVFQKYALFPHMNITDNIAFGLKVKKVNPEIIHEKVAIALKLVNMTTFAARFPESLSGGQQQRVALARAIVNEPQVLLLDEPLSALDQKLRLEMQAELKELQKKLGMTFVFVTHDQEEAFYLSDRIGVMNLGKLEQVSDPISLYQRPLTLFVADFVGKTTKIPCRFERPVANGFLEAKTASGQLIGSSQFTFQKQQQILALVRPEKLKVYSKDSESGNQISGVLTEMVFRGHQYQLTIEVQKELKLSMLLTTEEVNALNFQIGQLVKVVFKEQDTQFFLENSP